MAKNRQSQQKAGGSQGQQNGPDSEKIKARIEEEKRFKKLKTQLLIVRRTSDQERAFNAIVEFDDVFPELESADQAFLIQVAGLDQPQGGGQGQAQQPSPNQPSPDLSIEYYEGLKKVALQDLEDEDDVESAHQASHEILGVPEFVTALKSEEKIARKKIERRATTAWKDAKLNSFSFKAVKFINAGRKLKFVVEKWPHILSGLFGSVGFIALLSSAFFLLIVIALILFVIWSHNPIRDASMPLRTLKSFGIRGFMIILLFSFSSQAKRITGEKANKTSCSGCFVSKIGDNAVEGCRGCAGCRVERPRVPAWQQRRNVPLQPTYGRPNVPLQPMPGQATPRPQVRMPPVYSKWSCAQLVNRFQRIPVGSYSKTVQLIGCESKTHVLSLRPRWTLIVQHVVNGVTLRDATDPSKDRFMSMWGRDLKKGEKKEDFPYPQFKPESLVVLFNRKPIKTFTKGERRFFVTNLTGKAVKVSLAENVPKEWLSRIGTLKGDVWTITLKLTLKSSSERILDPDVELDTPKKKSRVKKKRRRRKRRKRRRR
ncbi:hypothetical protein KKH43_06745 [Patescibacteria group bacterium]|nr:hypothetical protein [Patescibacteria group bacterium]